MKRARQAAEREAARLREIDQKQEEAEQAIATARAKARQEMPYLARAIDRQRRKKAAAAEAARLLAAEQERLLALQQMPPAPQLTLNELARVAQLRRGQAEAERIIEEARKTIDRAANAHLAPVAPTWTTPEQLKFHIVCLTRWSGVEWTPARLCELLGCDDADLMDRCLRSLIIEGRLRRMS